MPVGGATLVAVSSNRGAAYDVVLLAHVLAAIVGFGAVALAGGYAFACRRSDPVSEAVRRYYRPGTNWAGRVVFAVPALGVALVGMSRGAWSFGDGWVGVGFGLWAAAAVAGELLLWPAERELQGLVGAGTEAAARRRALCSRITVTAAAMVVVFAVVSVVMVAKP